jgi:hypothetical protein
MVEERTWVGRTCRLTPRRPTLRFLSQSVKMSSQKPTRQYRTQSFRRNEIFARSRRNGPAVITPVSVLTDYTHCSNHVAAPNCEPFLVPAGTRCWGRNRGVPTKQTEAVDRSPCASQPADRSGRYDEPVSYCDQRFATSDNPYPIPFLYRHR